MIDNGGYEPIIKMQESHNESNELFKKYLRDEKEIILCLLLFLEY